MARPGVRYEQVAEIADRLAADGKQATPQVIRAELGEGSFSTITKHVRAWQESRRPQPQTQVRTMPDGVRRAFDQLWVALQVEADQIIEAVRADLMQRVRETLDRENEMSAELERVEQVREDLQVNLESSAQQIRALEQTLAMAHGQIQTLTDEVRDVQQQAERERDSAERARIEAAQARLQSDTLKESVGNLTADNKELRHALREAERQIAEAEKRAAVAEARLEERMR